MVDADHDGIDDALEGQMRLMLTMAGRAAETLAQARRQQLDNAARQSEQASSEARSRFEAERKAMHVEVGRTGYESWWERADAAAISHAWQSARAWEDEDPQAAAAVEKIRNELYTRYGIDTEQLDADPGAVQTTLAEVFAARDAADRERKAADLDKEEAAALAAADAAHTSATTAQEQERPSQPSPAETGASVAGASTDRSSLRYDSAERREVDAAQMRAAGVDDGLIDTRMRADMAQATPATEATRPTGKRAPKARKAHLEAARQVELGRSGR